MKICFLDASDIPYTSADINSVKLRGAENAIINLSNEFAKLGNKYQSKGVLCIKEDADKKIGNHPVKLRGVPCFHFYVNGKFISDYTITGADINQVEDKILQILN